MGFYDNKHYSDISNVLMSKYYNDTSNNLTNTKTLNLTGGSIRRQYEYIPQSFIQSREVEGRKLILSGTNVNYGGGSSTTLRIGGMSKKMKGGDILSDIGNFFKPIGSAALDILAPMAGAYVGGPMGATVAKGAREGLRAVTGVGLKKGRKAKMTGVGVYSGGAMNASGGAMSAGAMSGGCDGNMQCAPCAGKRGRKSKLAVIPSKTVAAGAKTAGAKKSKGNRMDMVKKIMKEKGLSLGAASKYIKDHNLY